MKKCLPKINGPIIIEEIDYGYSPEELFQSFAYLPNSSFLNSSLKTNVGRYSFIGISPFLTFTYKNNSICLNTGKHEFPIEGDPLEHLNSIIDTYKVSNPTSLPFISGGIGYFSYDIKNIIEKLPQKAKDDINLPDIYFAFYQALLIQDNLEPGKLYICITDIDSPEYKKPDELQDEIKKTITIDSRFSPSGTSRRNDRARGADTTPVIPEKAGIYKLNFESNFSKTDYIKAIGKILNHISAGDVYQICLSQRFKTKWLSDPYELYLKLNKISPAPFSAYLNLDGTKIISSSPELFLRLRNNVIETRPMKGTRPRGKDTEEDTLLKNDLTNNNKDKAELIMIVDLERNDLGRIAIPGSIKILEQRKIETYSTVFQAISVIKANIGNNVTPIDIIKAASPGGSITGCPKIRAMEIIDELEPTQRSLYTGSIGYISFHDTMDFNVAIRTIIMKGKDVYFQVGGGIIADSDPEAEYNETLDKARAMMESLK